MEAMNVAKLRKYCSANNIPYRGLKKQELEKNIKEHLFRIFIKKFNFHEDLFSNEKIKQIDYRKKHAREFKFDNEIFVKKGNYYSEDITVAHAKGAFNNMVADYTFYCETGKYDLYTYLFKIHNHIAGQIKKGLKRHESVTVQLRTCIQYEELDYLTGNRIGLKKYYLTSGTNKIMSADVINTVVSAMKNAIITKFNAFNGKNTKLRFDQVLYINLESDKYNPLRGGTYTQLPSFIMAKKCCINVKNIKTNKFKCEKEENLRCFEYALESILNPVSDHADRPSKYNIEKYESLNMQYPLAITEETIREYEKFLNISINVFKVVEKKKIAIYLLIQTKNIKNTHVNILLYNDHCVGIKNLSALLSGQIHKRNQHIYLCYKCHKKFDKKEKLQMHTEICVHNKINTTMPINIKGNNIRSYRSNGAELFHPFVLSLDFECFLKKISKKVGESSEYIQEHIPNSFSFHSNSGSQLVRYDDSTNVLMHHFNNFLISYGKEYIKLRRQNIPMTWTADIEKQYKNATHCHICNNEFNKDIKKVCDHNHTTGEFRGAACNSCNLNLRMPKFIPVLIHNLRYDSMIFLRWILKLSEGYSDIKIIPNSKEDYIQFSKKVIVDSFIQKYDLSMCSRCDIKHRDKIIEICEKCEDIMKIYKKGDERHIVIEFRFIDTFRFISTSLDKAVKNLAEVNNCYCSKCKSKEDITNVEFQPIENDIIKIKANCKKCGNVVTKPSDYTKFQNILKEFKKEDLHLVLQKGFYPYQWVDDYKKFNEQLPINKEDWYSILNDKNISDHDLSFAKKVYEHFNFKNFGEYHDLYLKLDTILLKDVFDNFRKTCYKNYNLDPVYYISAPNLANSASLKFTGQKLELIHNKYKDYKLIEKNEPLYEMYEKGIRGGISMIPHRHAIANNCYFYDNKIGKTVKLSKEKAIEKGIYNSKKHIAYILYLDCNNLYGAALSSPLPIGNFKYEPENEFTAEKILNLPDNGDKGYTFTVDLEIPKELHNKFKDYPLLPEHYTPMFEELSDYQKDLLNKKTGTMPQGLKLINTLKEKKNYIIDFRMLKECIKQGVILKKIHKVVSFTQKAWLKPYIDKNTKLRQEAKNDFEKDFYKLMNNSCFGKQMENCRKRCKVKLVNLEGFNNFVHYEERRIIDEDTVLYYKKQNNVKLNKPIYGGFVVLELSKLLMYKFYYNFLKTKYGDKLKLLATDTDSLIIYVETEDIYDDIKNNIKYFDTCGYNIDWMPQENNKVPGLFKDEYLGLPLREFVGLKSKMYAFRHDENDYKKSVKKVCKGIKKVNIEKMKFDMYKDCLFNNKTTKEMVYIISSKDYRLYTVQLEKIALSPYDDKRYLIDNVNTLPYGHYSLVNSNSS